jgi:putative endonuclease
MESSRKPNARTPHDSNAGFGRWPFWKRWFGRRSERYAARFLRKAGYKIIAANLADRRGEIDLLAIEPDRQTIVVVEVRSITGDDPTRAASSVDYNKQKKLTAITLRFLSRRRLLGQNVRFDILALAWPKDQSEPKLLHIPNAFPPTGQFQMFS